MTHFISQSDLKFVRKVYRGQWGTKVYLHSLTIQIPQWLIRMREFNFKNHTSTRCTTFPFGLRLPHDPLHISEWFEVRRESVQGTVGHQSAWNALAVTTIDYAQVILILKIILLGGVQPSRLGWTFHMIHLIPQSDLKCVGKVYRGQWGPRVYVRYTYIHLLAIYHSSGLEF